MGDELEVSSWELLSAYLDGALDDIAVSSLERALRHDRELQQSLDTLRTQKASLRSWAAEIDARPVTPGVQALIERARRDRDRRDDSVGHRREKSVKE